jgi:CelD/BcsL family acetyltransferase involved in cellulose biosynthesis
VLDLSDLPEQASALSFFKETFPLAPFACVKTQRCLCPYERLRPKEPFEDYLRRTGRRDNYMRRHKWLSHQPGFRIERTEEPLELPRALAEFFRLHKKRWDVDGGSQGIKGQRVEGFHREAVGLLAETKRVRLYTMWVGELAVASVYGILDGDKFLYYQSGYDPGWRSKSVGLVLVGETFKDALLEGRAEYDFLRGTEPYKSEWTTGLRRTVALRIFRRDGLGAWLHRAEEVEAQARRAAKAILPPSVTEEIRRMRRS